MADTDLEKQINALIYALAVLDPEQAEHASALNDILAEKRTLLRVAQSPDLKQYWQPQAVDAVEAWQPTPFFGLDADTE